MIGRDTATLGTALTGPHEGWTECFQDLNTWCPPPQDELNTPEIITDGFNFGTIDSCQVGDSNILSPAYIPLGEDAYLKPEIFDEFGFDEENNNIDAPSHFKEPPETSGGKTGGTYAKSPLKSTSSNILLTQGVLQGTPGIKPLGTNKFNKPTMETLQKGIFDFERAEDEENYLGLQQPRRPTEMKAPMVPVSKSISDSSTFVQPQKKDRPKLKLNITMPVNCNPAVVVMPSTPEVQNVLSEPKVGFDLIKYVVSGDNLIESVGDVAQIFGKSYSDYIIERDHDYVNPVIDGKMVCVKDEPMSPFSMAHGSIECPSVETENSSPNPESPKKRKSTKRRSDSNSDYIFDSDVFASDDSTEWQPPKKSAKTDQPRTKKKAKSSIRQPPSQAECNSQARPDSDAESVASSMTTDKYRELRDKNNEASRRSRLNRKARDLEIKRTADKLESENRGLRARAERMQKLVFEMREIILKTVKQAKKG